MSGYQRRRGSRPLLFERLAQAVGDAGQKSLQTARQQDSRLHDERALRASINSELSDLFNTRVPVPIDVLEGRERSTIDYGIPDLSAFPIGENAAMARLSVHLRDAIVAYEPRIHAPSVTIEQRANRPRALVAIVHGAIELNMMRTPVMFELLLDSDATDDDGI